MSARCRGVIGSNGFLFDWNQLELWSMPPGFIYTFTCNSEGACVLSRRIHNAHLSSPGADEDYDMVNICISCHLDIELAWFLEHFCFLDIDFLLWSFNNHFVTCRMNTNMFNHFLAFQLIVFWPNSWSYTIQSIWSRNIFFCRISIFVFILFSHK